ncbi:hypothetical protein JOC47_001708 [Halanaerobacter jeridensis]|uniref:Uncharacterized protein n=1 Tax=Halanaerobacter jeridensis TaxID=706427 RepID=A0A938XPN3_9FIRM|nr:hypothetical protein [Halanaerobacter jeridensis]
MHFLNKCKFKLNINKNIDIRELDKTIKEAILILAPVYIKYIISNDYKLLLIFFVNKDIM